MEYVKSRHAFTEFKLHKYTVKVLENKIILESNLEVSNMALVNRLKYNFGFTEEDVNIRYVLQVDSKYEDLIKFARTLVEDIRANGYNVELKVEDFILQSLLDSFPRIEFFHYLDDYYCPENTHLPENLNIQFGFHVTTDGTTIYPYIDLREFDHYQISFPNNQQGILDAIRWVKEQFKLMAAGFTELSV